MCLIDLTHREPSLTCILAGETENGIIEKRLSKILEIAASHFDIVLRTDTCNFAMAYDE
jgi:hypothetical protein